MQTARKKLKIESTRAQLLLSLPSPRTTAFSLRSIHLPRPLYRQDRVRSSVYPANLMSRPCANAVIFTVLVNTPSSVKPMYDLVACTEWRCNCPGRRIAIEEQDQSSCGLGDAPVTAVISSQNIGSLTEESMNVIMSVCLNVHEEDRDRP